jgi:glutamate N-acetyltransferase/amino-acid N-acetyltransferase
MTAQGGYDDAIEMTRLAAQHLGCRPEDIAVASTGVVGVRMPMHKVVDGIPQIEVTAEGGPSYARAIMTTDTRAKETAVRVTTPAGSYAVGGCAKGSGMIHPDMATMLAYVTTDAAVEATYLRTVQKEIAQLTLNMISVDGDTSCSDTFQVLANGAAGLPQITSGTPEAAEFREALLAVCTHLARELARDGEGAQRLITVDVTGAASHEDARQIARIISNSPLVKTAVTGCDPNWGRILVAAGRAGVPMDPAKASLKVQGIPMLQDGNIVAFDEKSTSDAMDAPEVVISLDLALGAHNATAWGCDLTTDYVHINADYRT